MSARTIRLQTTSGDWKPFICSKVKPEEKGTVEIYVPELKGTWVIQAGGMVGNVGGNDWRIYTLHPDDCAALCQ